MVATRCTRLWGDCLFAGAADRASRPDASISGQASGRASAAGVVGRVASEANEDPQQRGTAPMVDPTATHPVTGAKSTISTSGQPAHPTTGDPQQRGHRTHGRPNCHAPGDRCEVHHIDQWATGGSTDIGRRPGRVDDHPGSSGAGKHTEVFTAHRGLQIGVGSTESSERVSCLDRQLRRVRRSRRCGRSGACLRAIVEAHRPPVRHAPKVVFVEVDEDTSAYDRDHIAGAIKLDWRTDLQDPVNTRRRSFSSKWTRTPVHMTVTILPARSSWTGAPTAGSGQTARSCSASIR